MDRQSGHELFGERPKFRVSLYPFEIISDLTFCEHPVYNLRNIAATYLLLLRTNIL